MNEVGKKEFTHLKIHTQYSICEGALRTADLAKYCKENQVKAVGLCDSNNLCGALEFSELIAKSKTQPIIGTQINVKYKDHQIDSTNTTPDPVSINYYLSEMIKSKLWREMELEDFILPPITLEINDLKILFKQICMNLREF